MVWMKKVSDRGRSCYIWTNQTRQHLSSQLTLMEIWPLICYSRPLKMMVRGYWTYVMVLHILLIIADALLLRKSSHLIHSCLSEFPRCIIDIDTSLYAYNGKRELLFNFSYNGDMKPDLLVVGKDGNVSMMISDYRLVLSSKVLQMDYYYYYYLLLLLLFIISYYY